MNNARKSSFALYVDKVVTAVQTQYTYDANGGAIAGAGFYVYDITKDLNLTTTGSYKGYVVVNASDVDNPVYIVTLYDNNYQLINYNITGGMPTANSTSIQKYARDHGITNSYEACKASGIQPVDGVYHCYTRNGYLIVPDNGQQP